MNPFFSIQFGDSQKLRLVRILRSTVMVRVGGGWVALDEFLLKNDPCRGMYNSILSLYAIFNFKKFRIIQTNQIQITLIRQI